MSDLTPFKINTSKNFRAFCISLITGHLKQDYLLHKRTAGVYKCTPSYAFLHGQNINGPQGEQP